MRYIEKTQPAPAFLHGKAVPTSKEMAQKAWDKFKKTQREHLLKQLLAEQYHLCCYSEVRADLLELGYHIEHIEPKSRNPQRTFEYCNLAASALRSEQLANLPQQDHFGGHAKANRYAPSLFVSCHQRDCPRYFSYLSDGRIVPQIGLNLRDTRRARYTIALLNLNSEFLLLKRRTWWDEIEQLRQQHIADDLSLPDLAAVDLVPGRQGAGKLSPFFSLTRQFFGPIAEQVLQQHAPELV